MMIKPLELVSCIILFFSLFLTIKAGPKIPRYLRKREVDKDCDDLYIVEDMEFLKARGKHVICLNGRCQVVLL
jgi:hypothetical protein